MFRRETRQRQTIVWLLSRHGLDAAELLTRLEVSICEGPKIEGKEDGLWILTITPRELCERLDSVSSLLGSSILVSALKGT